MRRITFVVLIVSLQLAVSPASATHFRYGHISWSPTAPDSVEFTVQNAWRRSTFTSCTDPGTLMSAPCSGADGLPGLGDIVWEDVGLTAIDPGDGTSPIGLLTPPFFISRSLLYLVTAIDPTNDWLFGLALDPARLPSVDTTIAHTYPAPGTYTASIDSCCRIDTFDNGQHVNNPTGSYRVQTLVNVGTGNGSPASVIEPIQICGTNSLCEIPIPAGDPDQDSLEFRLATPTEASTTGTFLQPGEPGSGAPNAAAIDSATGIYTWDTTGATIIGDPLTTSTLYSTQVIIEDDSSKVALDFLIRLTTGDPVPPAFPRNGAGQNSVCGIAQAVSVGQTAQFEVSAVDADPGDNVRLNAIGLPPGATMTPALPVSGNPVTSVFSWTPTMDQVGVHVLSFSATSSGNGIGQTTCSTTLHVSDTFLIDVDFVPLSDRNPVNPRSRGLLPVVIKTSAEFDASTIDFATIEVGTGNATPAHRRGHMEDYDRDGDLDLVLHVRTQDTGIQCGDSSLTLTARTFGDQFVEGSNEVVTVGCAR